MSNPEKNTCFVIRPFCSPYDERHDNIFAPAIERAGLSVHFADSPGVINITEEIENGIRNAQICFADISEDNPNVWYEVGFAFAYGKKVAMVCNTERREADKLPFDIKVKKVILYDCSVDSKAQSSAQFQRKITEHVRELSKISPPSAPQPHILDKHQDKESSKNNLPSASQPPVEDDTSIIHDGLTREDLNMLLQIMKYCSMHGHAMSSYIIKKDWHDPLDADISIKKLVEKEYIVSEISFTFDGTFNYTSTEKAVILRNNHKSLFYK